jgi:hypothetical protein
VKIEASAGEEEEDLEEADEGQLAKQLQLALLTQHHHEALQTVPLPVRMSVPRRERQWNRGRGPGLVWDGDQGEVGLLVVRQRQCSLEHVHPQHRLHLLVRLACLVKRNHHYSSRDEDIHTERCRGTRERERGKEGGQICSA